MNKFVLTSVIFVSSVGVAQESINSLRMNPNQFQVEAPKSEKTQHRYVIDSSQKLIARCEGTEELVSASCEASTPKIFERDEFTHNVFTNTQIVTQPDGRQAECNAVNVHPEDVIRLSMSLRCLPNNSRKVTKNP